MRDVVISVLLTGVPDPQRGFFMQTEVVYPMIASARRHNVDLVMITTEDQKLGEGVEQVIIEQTHSPDMQRWISIVKYLEDNEDIDRVWYIDASDVYILKNPFTALNMTNGVLYCGDENTTVDNGWMRDHGNSPWLQAFIDKHADKQLLNSGILGGHRKDVMQFLSENIAAYYEHINSGYEHLRRNMPIFNYIAYTKYPNIIHGMPINTEFRAYDVQNPTAIFAHK